MQLEFLQDWPVAANLALFGVVCGAIWVAGDALAKRVAKVAERTALGAAFLGVLLLGGITSLPEAATTASAALLGAPGLAVNNVFGGVALQVTLLAVADAVVRRGGLSVGVTSPTILLQGALCVLVLLVAIGGVVTGDVAVLGVGVWTATVFGVATVGLYLIKAYEADPRWEVVGREEQRRLEAERERKEEEKRRVETEQTSMRALVVGIVIAGAVILLAGYVVARTGEVLAEQTGMGSSFVGAVLVAASTSLPELSTTIAAVRAGATEMAISNIFGTNLFDLAFLFLADLLYRGGPVLEAVGQFSILAALLGAALTIVYLIGMIEREDTRVLGMGIDSIIALLLYIGGIIGLWAIR